MSDPQPKRKLTIQELIERHLLGELDEPEKERLAHWLDSDPSARREFIEQARWDTDLAGALREEDGLSSVSQDTLIQRLPRSKPGAPPVALLGLLLAGAAIMIVALSLTLYFQQASTARRLAEVARRPISSATHAPIARISGLSGALTWTGDRGQVARALRVGMELAGGTIEGLAPDSWFELQFTDGSTVMIGGASTLTFSDLGQKQLHLKRGRLAAHVVPQPPDKPMIVHTRAAMLQVLGTRFEVEAKIDSTALHVSEGNVRVRRLADGRTIDVPARHRVVTGADASMSPAPVPDAVHAWKSQLHLGPKETYGSWSPAGDRQPASLKAIPFVPEENQAVTLYLLGLPVNRDDDSPVVVKPGARFVVRGRLAKAADLFFGVYVTRHDGAFAGKFLARQPAASFKDDSEFEAVFPLDQFGLDPCVWDRKEELPRKPDGHVVNYVWSFTHAEGPTGLQVEEVELIPAAAAREPDALPKNGHD